MRQAVSKGVYAYWNSLRGERAAPERADLDPAAMRHLLADSFLIEIDVECLFPIRWFGTRLAALWREDQQGRSFLDLWRSEDRRAVAAAMLTVIDGVTPVVGGAKAQKRDERTALDRDMDFEILLLPLRHHGKTHSRVLGALSASAPPAWFGRAEAGPLLLSSLRVIREVERPAPLGGRPRGRPAGMAQLIVYNGGKSY
jgi:hypothetical protein